MYDKMVQMIVDERRAGDSLAKIFNEHIKRTPEEQFPFEALSLVSNGECLDFTTPEWVALGKTNVENQIKNATAYQIWFAREFAKKLEVDIEKEFLLNEKIKIWMRLIPPGKYWQGSPESEKNRRSDEKQRKVLISKPFWCGKYPVTQEQWKSVMLKNLSSFKGNPRNPVENVDWEKCQKFFTETGMKLLSEAQWEYACRAGTTTAYCFGDNPEHLGKYAWYEGNSKRTTHSVGEKEKRANAWGVHEMHGNVWEWCEDDYNKIYGGETIDPEYKDHASGSDRVYRGGSWYDFASCCRSASRDWGGPCYSRHFLGFRVWSPCS